MQISMPHDQRMPTLREIRLSKKLSQAKLAKLAGASQPDIHRLEKGERKLTVDWVMRLSRAMKINPEDLLPTGGARPAASGARKPDAGNPSPGSGEGPPDIDVLYYIMVRVDYWLQEDDNDLDPTPEQKALLVLAFYDAAKDRGKPAEQFNPRDYPNVIRLSRNL